MRQGFILLIALLLSSCGTTPIDYQSKSLEIDKAISIIEELTYAQHPNWRPDAITITNDFIEWNYGMTSTSNGIATAIGNSGVIVGGGKSSIRNVGDRSYYRSISRVVLNSWKRKGRQWYTVAIFDNNESGKHVFRTRRLTDAQLYTDALRSITEYYSNKSK